MGWAAAIAHLIQPFMDFYSGNKFSTAYRSRMLGDLQAQESQMRMQQQQMDINRQRMMDYIAQAKANHSLILAEYEDVFNRMQGEHPISKEQAEEEIAELNAKHDHHVLDVMLRNHDLSGVWNQLRLEDAKFQDVVNAYTSIYESDRRRSASGTSGGELGRLIDGSGEGGGGGAFSALAPPSDMGGAATPSPEGSTLSDDEIAKQTGMIGGKEGYGMTMAHEGLNTGKYDGLTSAQFDKEAKGERSRFGGLSPAAKVRNAQKMLENKIDRLANKADVAGLENDPDLAQEAQTIKGLMDYTLNEKDLPQGEVRTRFANWAGRFSNHQYNTKDFENANSFYKESSPSYKTAVAAARIPQQFMNVLEDLKGRSETDPIPLNVLKMWAANNWTGDPKWSTLGTALQQFLTSVQGIQQGGGTPRVTLVEHMLQRAATSMSPRALRAMMQQELVDSWAGVHAYQEQWEGFGKSNVMPGFNPKAWRDFSTLLRMDPNTQQMPKDADPIFQSLGKSSSKPLPPTAKEAREIHERIQSIISHPDFDNPGSPNYSSLHDQYSRFLQQYRNVNNPPWAGIKGKFPPE